MIFSLLIFISMMLATGMAVDFVRYEHTRTKLQATLDRSVVAAAAMTDAQAAEDVVRSFFDKADLPPHTLDVMSDGDANSMDVQALATADVPSFFLNMVGIDSIRAVARGGAGTGIQQLEISLVVDTSGSMGWNNRMTNLKVAAKDFVDTIMGEGVSASISMNVIPYNAVVAVDQSLFGLMNVNQIHTYSTCIQFEGTDYNTTRLDTLTGLRQLNHFQRSSSTTRPIYRPQCDTTGRRKLIPFANNPDVIKAAIDDLYASGNTAADLGMKWAVGLMDPNSNGIVNSLINQNVVDPIFEARPAAWEDVETRKIIVLMTDGDNTYQHDIKTQYKSGDSNIWKNAYKNRYAVYLPSRGYYFLIDEDGDFIKKRNSLPSGYTERLQWEDIWATYTTRGFGKFFYKHSYNGYPSEYYQFNSDYDVVKTIANRSTSDSQLLSMCSKAKNNNVTVFTIGFEAPAHGSDIMEQCATSGAHYYDADGLEIADAFSAIAGTIQKLKLTN